MNEHKCPGCQRAHLGDYDHCEACRADRALLLVQRARQGFRVVWSGKRIVIFAPPPAHGMTPAEALTLAAYLVTMAECADRDLPSFADVLAAVQST